MYKIQQIKEILSILDHVICKSFLSFPANYECNYHHTGKYDKDSGRHCYRDDDLVHVNATISHGDRRWVCYSFIWLKHFIYETEQHIGIEPVQENPSPSSSYPGLHSHM